MIVLVAVALSEFIMHVLSSMRDIACTNKRSHFSVVQFQLP